MNVYFRGRPFINGLTFPKINILEHYNANLVLEDCNEESTQNGNSRHVFKQGVFFNCINL